MFWVQFDKKIATENWKIGDKHRNRNIYRELRSYRSLFWFLSHVTTNWLLRIYERPLATNDWWCHLQTIRRVPSGMPYARGLWKLSTADVVFPTSREFFHTGSQWKKISVIRHQGTPYLRLTLISALVVNNLHPLAWLSRKLVQFQRSANHTISMITWLRDENIQEGSIRGREIFWLRFCLQVNIVYLLIFSLSFSSRKETQNMGRIFLHHPGGARLYSCANCDTALTNRSQLTSMVSYNSYRTKKCRIEPVYSVLPG